MKSLLFKSAWSIFKMKNVSFSQALTLAWSKLKQGLKAVIVKSNKLVKSTKWIGYETIYFNELVFANIVTAVGVVSNDGAKHDYGVGIYNGD